MSQAPNDPGVNRITPSSDALICTTVIYHVVLDGPPLVAHACESQTITAPFRDSDNPEVSGPPIIMVKTEFGCVYVFIEMNREYQRSQQFALYDHIYYQFTKTP